MIEQHKSSVDHIFKYSDIPAPIIIVGMHRSGTTLLTRLLEEFGFFMGSTLTGNRESIFFQRLNKEVLDVLGVSWRCLDYLPQVKDLTEGFRWMRDFLINKLEIGLLPGHFGESYPQLMTDGWGWKDPRNSLLLPIWHDIFPDARIIHIYRDGRQVSLSLLKREMKREKPPTFYCNEIIKKYYQSNLELWKAYIMRIQESIGAFPYHHTMRYENLLTNPNDELCNLLHGIGINTIDRSILTKASAIIEKSQRFNHSIDEFPWLRMVALDEDFFNEIGYPVN